MLIIIKTHLDDTRAMGIDNRPKTKWPPITAKRLNLLYNLLNIYEHCDMRTLEE